MIGIKKNYLSDNLLKQRKPADDGVITLLVKLRKHPVTAFALFAVLMVVVKVLSDYGIIGVSVVDAISTTIIYCIVALGFCLLLGYSALASLGTAGFIALGAYSAYYCLAVWGLTVSVAFIVAISVAVVIGIIVGYISLRIEGIYLAIVTLGISQIIKEVLQANVDTIKISGSQIVFFGIETMKITRDHVFFMLVGLIFILMIITSNLMNSPTGRAMLAMKNSTSAAQAFGISLLKYRLMAFIISIIYASVAGLMYMLSTRYVSSSSSTLFTLSTSLNILGAVIIGGTKSIWGTIGGTFIIYGIDRMFLQDIAFFRDNPTLITLLCGILVVLVIMFYPGGLAQLLIELKFLIKKLFLKIREAKYGKDLG